MNTSQSVPFEPTPEQQHYLEHVPVGEVPRTPTAAALVAQGREKKAARFDHCGDIRARKCDLGHIDRRMKFMCGLRFVCETCQLTRARILTNDWLPVLEGVICPHKWFSFLTLEIPIGRSTEDASAYLESMKDKLFHQGSTAYWIKILGFCGDKFLVRLLILDTQQTQDLSYWQSILPEVVSSNTVLSDRLTWFFEKEFAKPFVINDPEDSAAQEVLFERMHLIRAVGLKKPKTKAEKFEDPVVDEEGKGDGNIFVEEGDSTTNKSTPFTHCLTCKKRLTFTAGVQKPFFNPLAVTWKPIPEPQPPEESNYYPN